HSLTRLMFPIAGALLALTAALAAACFVKAFGIPFLALPRSEAAATAQEAAPAMRYAMAFLAAACFGLGLGATSVLPARVPTGPAGDCCLPGLTSDNEYTATAFSKPLRLIFSAFYRPNREIRPEYDVSPYYPSAIRFESGIEPTFEKHIYGPLKDWVFALSRRMRAIQAGSIHAYLAYIFVTLILLLLFGVRQ